MGIQGLHQELKRYTKPAHVEQFAGKRVAIDGYSWLHKAAYSCAGAVAQGLTPWANAGRRAPYVEYCLHRVRARSTAPVLACGFARRSPPALPLCALATIQRPRCDCSGTTE